MQSSRILSSITVSLGLALLAPTAIQAGTVVKQLDSGTIRVVRYEGKPPHQRLTIDSASHPELFAYYAERVDTRPMPVMLSERRGAPGKSLPRTVLRVTADKEEIAEFARFEERDSSEATSRSWRGAPGKGRALP